MGHRVGPTSQTPPLQPLTPPWGLLTSPWQCQHSCKQAGQFTAWPRAAGPSTRTRAAPRPLCWAASLATSSAPPCARCCVGSQVAHRSLCRFSHACPWEPCTLPAGALHEVPACSMGASTEFPHGLPHSRRHPKQQPLLHSPKLRDTLQPCRKEGLQLPVPEARSGGSRRPWAARSLPPLLAAHRRQARPDWRPRGSR